MDEKIDILYGGLQTQNQGNTRTCYSESATRVILKLLKRPDIKLLEDINDFHDKTALRKLNEFENDYIFLNKKITLDKLSSIITYDPLSKFLKVLLLTYKMTLLESFIIKFKTITDILTIYSNFDENEKTNLADYIDMSFENMSVKDDSNREYKFKDIYSDKVIDLFLKLTRNDAKENVDVLQKHYFNSVNEIIKKYSFNKGNFLTDRTKEGLLKNRKLFLENNHHLKEIIDKQVDYYNKINSFFIFKVGTSGWGEYIFEDVCDIIKKKMKSVLKRQL